MEQESDRQLVIAAHAGDKVAFGILVERYFARARLIAWRLVANAETADELTQEALLQAYLGLTTLREPTHFAPWLYGIVRNLCRTWLRRQRVSITSLDLLTGDAPVAPAHLVDPVALLEERELAALVQSALTTLSPKNGAATWLFYYEGLSVDEIATTLGAAPNAIKGRLYQSRKQLQAYLAPLRQPVAPVRQTPIHVDERKIKMTTISTVQILKIEQSGAYALYLLDTVGQRFLQMWVDSTEGEQIHSYLYPNVSSRTLTYRYIADLLQALAVKLEEVQITTLQNNIFYAVAHFRNGDTLRSLDARPSQAIAVALHTQSPIRVTEQLMQEASQPLPADFVVEHWLAAEAQRLQAAFGWRDQIVQESDRTFTGVARQVLQAARTQASARQHNYIGTEHLLWGLTAITEGLAADILQEYSITLSRVNDTFERLVQRGEFPPTEEPMIVPRVATVLTLAVTASQQGGHSYIGTEHLLLGLLQEGNGMAMRILRDLGADPTQIQAQLIEVMATR